MEKWKLPSPSQDPFFQRSYLRPLSVCVHCPGCNKLYKIDTRDLRSKEPQFNCTDCKTVFTIERCGERSGATGQGATSAAYVSTSNIYQAKILSRPPVGNQIAEGLKKCPKCEAFNPILSEDCLKCGVIFSKLENLPMDQKLGALPSLVRAWQGLIRDYSNLTKHVEFVDRCEELNATPYALKKYLELKELQPQDEIAQQMLHRTLMKNFEKKAIDTGHWWIKKNPWILKVNQRINWSKLIRYSPFVLAGLMILIGFFSEGLRNLIGFGVSLSFLLVGVTVLFRSRHL